MKEKFLAFWKKEMDKFHHLHGKISTHSYTTEKEKDEDWDLLHSQVDTLKQHEEEGKKHGFTEACDFRAMYIKLCEDHDKKAK